MIIDASVVIDAVADDGPRGTAAREALRVVPADEPLLAPGHHAVEVLAGLRVIAALRRRSSPVRDVPYLMDQAEKFGIRIEGTPWVDMHRAWDLAQGSLSLADAVYIAAAERLRTAFLTADRRIERSGAAFRCDLVTVGLS